MFGLFKAKRPVIGRIKSMHVIQGSRIAFPSDFEEREPTEADLSRVVNIIVGAAPNRKVFWLENGKTASLRLDEEVFYF